MKGYISATDYNTRDSIYINASTIVSIAEYETGARIEITCGEFYLVRETVEAVCDKILSATEQCITKSISIETTSNGWINVQDRLPNDRVNVQIGYKTIPNGCVYRDCIAYIEDGTWHLCYDENIVITETVVAWKPLSDVYAIADLWRCEE